MSFESLFGKVKVFNRPEALTEEDYAAVTFEAIQSVAVQLPNQLWALKTDFAMPLKEKQVYVVRSLEEQLGEIVRKHGQEEANNLKKLINDPVPWLKKFYEKWATFTPGKRSRSGQMNTGNLLNDTINEIKIHVPEFTKGWEEKDPEERKRNLDKIQLTPLGKDVTKLIYLKIHRDIMLRNDIQEVRLPLRTSTDFTSTIQTFP